MDAFGAAHRLESSTYGIIKFAPQSCIGILFKKEIQYLKGVLSNAKRPIVTIIGGAKISTKFHVIKKLSNISDKIIIGGGIANTFLASQGHNIGKSLNELNYIDKAKVLLETRNNLILPKDSQIFMPNILKLIGSGVIFGDKIKQLFTIAKKQGFAIPAINCIGTDSINASLEVASKLRSPVIIQFSYSGASFIAGKKINATKGSILGAISGALHVHNVAKDYNVPVILHTDHCSKKMLPW
uniref:Phosphoglycerate kinase n=1 Tax=Glossina pallidipes TaxID=7398 RepID=A0A1A9Z181_GLOPL